MKRWIAGAACALASFAAFALQPYVAADKVAGGNLKTAMSAAEQKLVSAGFAVLGRHTPVGLPEYGTVVVADTGLTAAIARIGGSAVVGLPVRIGVKADGTVSYMNPEYWERAYLRQDYGKAEPAVKDVAARLEKALGGGAPFGGDVKPEALAQYHYMFGMEYFDERSELRRFGSFDEAVGTVRANLAKGVAHTAKVYEWVMPEKKIAVFGVAMNDLANGEGWWVNKIGPDHIAAMPWEIFIVDGKAFGLYGRYRTALAWPSLSMGQFMGIVRHPDTTAAMLKAVAGAAE